MSPETSSPFSPLEPDFFSLRRMDPDELARRLDPLPERVPDPAPGERAAAVLLAIRPGVTGDAILLVERAGHLDEHAGQMALPGGRLDPGDPHPAAAALREAEEEVGLRGDQLRVLGALRPLSVPVSRHRVLPVVGWLAADAEARIGSEETAAFWFVPLAELARCRRDSGLPGRAPFEYPISGGDEGPERLIWGMTALVLDDLLWRLQYSETGKATGR